MIICLTIVYFSSHYGLLPSVKNRGVKLHSYFCARRHSLNLMFRLILGIEAGFVMESDVLYSRTYLQRG